MTLIHVFLHIFIYSLVHPSACKTLPSARFSLYLDDCGLASPSGTIPSPWVVAAGPSPWGRTDGNEVPCLGQGSQPMVGKGTSFSPGCLGWDYPRARQDGIRQPQGHRWEFRLPVSSPGDVEPLETLEEEAEISRLVAWSLMATCCVACSWLWGDYPLSLLRMLAWHSIVSGLKVPLVRRQLLSDQDHSQSHSSLREKSLAQSIWSLRQTARRSWHCGVCCQPASEWHPLSEKQKWLV